MIGLLTAAIGIALGLPVITAYLYTGLVRRFPTAILAIGLVILGSVNVVTGIILDVVTKTRRESRRIAYLSMPRCDV